MSARDLGPTPLQIDRMRRGVADGIHRHDRRRHRRVRAALVSSAVVIAVGVTAGTFATSVPTRLVGGSYFCLETDDQRSEYHAISHPLDETPPTEVGPQVAASLEYCAIVFAREAIVAPHPTVCRFADGRLGVFPNLDGREPDALCSYVGLPTP
jgi:hypothetical protein